MFFKHKSSHHTIQEFGTVACETVRNKLIKVPKTMYKISFPLEGESLYTKED
jgi:hypothetical protein